METTSVISCLLSSTSGPSEKESILHWSIKKYWWWLQHSGVHFLTLVLLNKLRCHTYFQFSANQITWSSLLMQIHILNDKQCSSRSVGFFRSQLIWIYTVCKGRVDPGSAGEGLINALEWVKNGGKGKQKKYTCSCYIKIYHNIR